MKLEKKCEYTDLFNFYKNMLTPRKREIGEKFYNQDIAMIEIAALENVSRQAIKDCLKKSEEKLTKYEEKLNLAKIYYAQQKLVDKLIEKNPEMSDELNEILALWED